MIGQKTLHEHAVLYNPTNIKEADPSKLKFKTFPRVLILVGSDEVLLDDARNFYAYIKPVKAQAELKEFDGQTHVWLVSHIASKASIEAMNDIREFFIP